MKILVFVCALLLPAIARAQSSDPPRIELRASGGFSNNLHGDIDGTAPSLRVAIRMGPSRFAFEPEFVIARLEERESFSTTIRVTRTTFQSIGMNAIVRGQGSRVSPYGGGGVGVYWHRRRTQTVSTQISFQTGFDSDLELGAQALGGLDVRIVSRVSAIAEVRYEMRSFADPGGGSVVQGFGGIAIAVR
jgi:opacity protein-like surface antigen